MKMCQPHWDKLRKSIADAGMAHLVAPTGEELQKRIAEDGYCPLAAATSMIYSNALSCGGEYLLTGDYCPLCELDKHADQMAGENSETWTQKATDGAMKFAVEKKLITVQ